MICRMQFKQCLSLNSQRSLKGNSVLEVPILVEGTARHIVQVESYWLVR